MIAIIDYGAGNLHSVKNALSYLDAKYVITNSPNELKKADKIILPGVGHFGQASTKLQNSGCYSELLEWIKQDKPFLGICVGLQLLMESSSEAPSSEGFGFFQGNCEKFTCQRVPQMGWNQVHYEKKHPLFASIPNDSDFYFVHSFYPNAKTEKDILATCTYDVNFGAILQRGNVFGTQFHPEKSGEMGLQLLRNWINL